MNPSIELPTVPEHWQRGELLDKIGFTGPQGDYYVFKRHFIPPHQVDEGLRIDGPDAANDFLGWWYAR